MYRAKTALFNAMRMMTETGSNRSAPFASWVASRVLTSMGIPHATQIGYRAAASSPRVAPVAHAWVATTEEPRLITDLCHVLPAPGSTLISINCMILGQPFQFAKDNHSDGVYILPDEGNTDPRIATMRELFGESWDPYVAPMPEKMRRLADEIVERALRIAADAPPLAREA